jgi:hypothetical protein
MHNACIIDDVEANLISSNAKIKICYGYEYEWNKGTQHKRITNYEDLEDYLEEVYWRW